jgi:hypothetical protein
MYPVDELATIRLRMEAQELELEDLRVSLENALSSSGRLTREMKDMRSAFESIVDGRPASSKKQEAIIEEQEVIEPAIDQRQEERHPLMMDAMVRISDSEFKAVIFDISAGGAKLQIKEGLGQLDVNEQPLIVLIIPQFGEFHGEPAWVDDDFVGVRFHENHKTIVKLIQDS